MTVPKSSKGVLINDINVPEGSTDLADDVTHGDIRYVIAQLWSIKSKATLASLHRCLTTGL